MKKAQSALEFLTTYGWAFLVILIMIGALAYFGILNPSRYLPERCTVTPGFSCDEFEVRRDSTSGALNFTMIMKNGVGSSVLLQSLGANTELGQGVTSGSFGVNATTCFATPVTVGPDEKFTVFCEGTTTIAVPSAGNKQKITFNITYLPSGKTLPQSISGEMFGTIQNT